MNTKNLTAFALILVLFAGALNAGQEAVAENAYYTVEVKKPVKNGDPIILINVTFLKAETADYMNKVMMGELKSFVDANNPKMDVMTFAYLHHAGKDPDLDDPIGDDSTPCFSAAKKKIMTEKQLIASEKKN